MKHKTMLIVMALIAMLTVGPLAGCGQNASSESSPAQNTSSETQEQSKDEVIAELKSAAANAPEFKSVTVNETTAWTYVDGDAAKPETIQATGTYKFDMSGDQPKESITAEYGNEKLQYFTDGKNAVLVLDGTAYSGTAEQFGAQDYSGFDTFIKHVIGERDAIIGYTTSAQKVDADGLNVYALTLDPQKYLASDPMLTVLADAGYPVKDALLTISLNKDGNVVSMNMVVGFEGSGLVESLEFSDFGSTVVDPTPEATKTYEEMDEDKQQEIEQLIKTLDAYDASAGEASPEATTNAS